MPDASLAFGSDGTWPATTALPGSPDPKLPVWWQDRLGSGEDDLLTPAQLSMLAEGMGWMRRRHAGPGLREVAKARRDGLHPVSRLR